MLREKYLRDDAPYFVDDCLISSSLKKYKTTKGGHGFEAVWLTPEAFSFS